jgi:hypothetical protein
VPSPVYQYVINQVVSVPIRRGLGVLMNVVLEWEHCVLTNRFFDVSNFTTLTPISLHPDVDSHSQLLV